MQYKHICGAVVLSLLVSQLTLAQDSPKASIQLNMSASTSQVVGVDESDIVSPIFKVDPAFGLTGRMVLAHPFGIRFGAYFAQTSARYSMDVPAGPMLPAFQQVTITRTRLGLRVPLTLDVAIASTEKMRFAWLVGALMYIDFEERNTYRFANLPEIPETSAGSQLPVSMALETGFEFVFPLKGGQALGIATEVSASVPNNSSYAYSDFSPSASLLSAGLRVTYELAAERAKPSESGNEQNRKNTVLMGYGGRTYNRSGNIGYERQILELRYLSASLQATVGYGSYGAFGSTGGVVSVGSSKHALDLGLAWGYIEDLNRSAGVFEYGYRFTSLNGIVGRAYFTYWGNLAFLGASAVGVSIGKAF